MRTINKVPNAKRLPAFPTEAEANEAKLRKANELLAKANLAGLPDLPERPREEPGPNPHVPIPPKYRDSL